MNKDIKLFAEEIAEKLSTKQLQVNGYREGVSTSICDAVRQMVEHKLTKEGWIKLNTRVEKKEAIDEDYDDRLMGKWDDLLNH